MDLQESWALTTEDLRQAAMQLPGVDGLAEFKSFLDHNELELAADVLHSLADEREVLSTSLWQPPLAAYERMNLVERAARCRLRLFESKWGFVEILLELLATSAGGRQTYVLDGYCPNWDIGGVTEQGEKVYSDARTSLEDCRKLEPGNTALARLHPLFPEGWSRVAAGTMIFACERKRVVGTAMVVRNTIATGPLA